MSKFFKYITTPVKQMKEWFSQKNSNNTQIQFNEYYYRSLPNAAALSGVSWYNIT